MTAHLPECPMKPIAEAPVDFHQHFPDCICPALRACEQRVREEESRNVIGSVSLAAIGEANLQQYQLGYTAGLDAAREAVDRLASDMAKWSSAETAAATDAIPDLTVDEWMWAQHGVGRALAAIDALQREKP